MAVERWADLTPRERRKRERTEGHLDGWVDRQSWMDPLANGIQGLTGGFYGALGRPGRALKDMLHGTWPLGHPLHPALTDVPLGAWTVAVALDYFALATQRVPAGAGDAALLIGIIGALMSAAAGYTDFHETYGTERRVGLLHGLTMTFTLVVMIASFVIRVATTAVPAHNVAIGISTVGYSLALVGAYFGGHLTFRFGTMVNRHGFTAPRDTWTAVGHTRDFPEDQMRLVDAAGTPVLIVRRHGILQAIADTCSHAGGPLHEGTLEGDLVTCPWHGSRFCVTDGAVRGGPATFVQPAFLVHEQSGEVRVKPAAAPH